MTDYMRRRYDTVFEEVAEDPARYAPIIAPWLMITRALRVVTARQTYQRQVSHGIFAAVLGNTWLIFCPGICIQELKEGYVYYGLGFLRRLSNAPSRGARRGLIVSNLKVLPQFL